MNSLAALGLRAMALATVLAAPTLHAQELARSYVASPDVYKVLAENAQYRVIAVTWKAGQRDVMHSHPASALYYLSDCRLRIVQRDGSSRDVTVAAGFALVQDPIAAHAVENIGAAECRLVMFEPV